MSYLIFLRDRLILFLIMIDKKQNICNLNNRYFNYTLNAKIK